jgi:hypothetical protein
MPHLYRAEDKLEIVEGRYDPEHDVPVNQPQVTWADIYLAAAMRALLAECKYLKEQIANLEYKLNQLDQR